MTMVDRVSGFLESRLSRRSFVVRSAFAGSALTVSGTSYLLEPGTAYAQVCSCGSSSCGCGTTCCAGYTEFCCVLNGENMCPAGTVMGGWWKADGSIYCSGPRYYMDCNATCSCTSGCGSGFGFCDPGCDGLNCECAGGSCDNYLTGCFQFRYGQCNQNVSCLGRIHCRVVSCVPPWEIDPSCTTTAATDDNTANQTTACLTPAPPPPETCTSATQCETVAVVGSRDGKGYTLVTSFG
ncbi:MAG: hypothetical protein FWC87_01285, partial [Acidimicrobiaceae bacterium]|nr:hypothetical protein [Acidimicrobiaceae bacterium]